MMTVHVASELIAQNMLNQNVNLLKNQLKQRNQQNQKYPDLHMVILKSVEIMPVKVLVPVSYILLMVQLIDVTFRPLPTLRLVTVLMSGVSSVQEMHQSIQQDGIMEINLREQLKLLMKTPQK